MSDETLLDNVPLVEKCDFCDEAAERYGYQRDVEVRPGKWLVACCNACEGGLKQIAAAGAKVVQPHAYKRVRELLGLTVYGDEVGP